MGASLSCLTNHVKQSSTYVGSEQKENENEKKKKAPSLACTRQTRHFKADLSSWHKEKKLVFTDEPFILPNYPIIPFSQRMKNGNLWLEDTVFLLHLFT